MMAVRVPEGVREPEEIQREQFAGPLKSDRQEQRHLSCLLNKQTSRHERAKSAHKGSTVGFFDGMKSGHLAKNMPLTQYFVQFFDALQVAHAILFSWGGMKMWRPAFAVITFLGAVSDPMLKCRQKA